MSLKQKNEIQEKLRHMREDLKMSDGWSTWALRLAMDEIDRLENSRL